MVSANTVKQAYDRMVESLKGLMVDFQIPSIMVSPIVEIFPYSEEMDKEIGRRVMTEEETEEFETTGKGPVFSASGSDFDDNDSEEVESEIEDDFDA